MDEVVDIQASHIHDSLLARSLMRCVLSGNATKACAEKNIKQVNNVWKKRTLPFRFRLGEITLFSVAADLNVCAMDFLELRHGNSCHTNMPEIIPDGIDGYLIHSMPVEERLLRVDRTDRRIRYIPRQYERYYIDLTGSAEDYLKKFSSKSRSTLRRKVSKFAKYSGGDIDWREYSSPEEMAVFYEYARTVSELTYQERLLKAGFPAGEEFHKNMQILALENSVRGYLLFHHEKPIAYLYTPIQKNSLIYQHLGYDPDYAKWSPGTVLQWLVIEKLFKSGSYDLFDFTAGEGSHKKYFSTGSQWCADVYYLRPTLRNRLVVSSHSALDLFSDRLADALEFIGVKKWIKNALRRGHARHR